MAFDSKYTGAQVEAAIEKANKLTVNDAKITIQLNGSDIGTFTVNTAEAKTINITLSKSDVDLSNVDNTADSNKTVKHAATADSATKATQDSEGNVISDTYIKKGADEATDGEYIYMKDAKGKPVIVKKAEFMTITKGYIGLASTVKDGFLSKKNAFSYEGFYLAPNTPKIIKANGFLMIKCEWFWGGYELWWISYEKAVKLVGADWSIQVSISANYPDNTVTIINHDTQTHYYNLYYMDITADI